MQSALRYVDSVDPFALQRNELMLPPAKWIHHHG